MLDRIRIVLVRPSGAANLGSICRAMMNMGLRDLVLVRPEVRRDDPQAVAYAVRATRVLDAAREVDSIADALRDCVTSFATSAKGGIYRKNAAVTAEQGAGIALDAAERGPVAIAFGPEDHGLVLRELLEFDRVIEIPANPEYPTLNLAAAVLLVSYECRRSFLARQGGPPASRWVSEPATDVQKRRLFERLFAALDRIGFFARDQSPDHLKFALRHALGRVDLSLTEVDILLGMAQQIAWFADQRTGQERS